MSDYQKSGWSNKSYSIRWFDADRVEITGPYDDNCIMDGGDFESALSTLIAAYTSGRERQRILSAIKDKK